MHTKTEKAANRQREALQAIDDFKRKVRGWLEAHPQASVDALELYCKKLKEENKEEIPEWVLEETLAWFQYYKKIQSANEVS